jgi:hypothetical protein
LDVECQAAFAGVGREVGLDRGGVEEVSRGICLARIIHEGFVNNLDLMTNDQFPMTKQRRGAHRAVEVLPKRLFPHWPLVITTVRLLRQTIAVTAERIRV